MWNWVKSLNWHKSRMMMLNLFGTASSVFLLVASSIEAIDLKEYLDPKTALYVLISFSVVNKILRMDTRKALKDK